MAEGLGRVLPHVPPESTQQAVGYPSLFLLVVLGSLVPVVPTGAVVSSAAVVAFHHSSPLAPLYVFAVASCAAFLGDLGLYWLGRRGAGSRNGSRWLARLRARAAPEHLARARRQLRDHGVLVLVLSRLVPAGRIPVMLACLFAAVPPRRFARGDLPACLAWAAAYELIGLLSGSLFRDPWEGVAAAIGLTVLLGAVPAGWRRVAPERWRRPRPAPAGGPTGALGAADGAGEGAGAREGDGTP
ncbi:hypothetical protein ADL22_31500 [Streptomyces sp. NRRL F-4489]|nr:hypothetical protein ADL22_31500 [Streptomyces sp. NRRL F-4489]